MASALPSPLDTKSIRFRIDHIFEDGLSVSTETLQQDLQTLLAFITSQDSSWRQLMKDAHPVLVKPVSEEKGKLAYRFYNLSEDSHALKHDGDRYSSLCLLYMSTVCVLEMAALILLAAPESMHETSPLGDDVKRSFLFALHSVQYIVAGTPAWAPGLTFSIEGLAAARETMATTPAKGAATIAGILPSQRRLVDVLSWLVTDAKIQRQALRASLQHGAYLNPAALPQAIRTSRDLFHDEFIMPHWRHVCELATVALDKLPKSAAMPQPIAAQGSAASMMPSISFLLGGEDLALAEFGMDSSIATSSSADATSQLGRALLRHEPVLTQQPQANFDQVWSQLEQIQPGGRVPLPVSPPCIAPAIVGPAQCHVH